MTTTAASAHRSRTTAAAAGADAPTSWLGWKERGKSLFEQGDYRGALQSYQQALLPQGECVDPLERAVLLSNSVACRLHLNDNIAAAIQDAQECVRLRPNWSKAHVRLASAYSADGRSNDACRELQTALRLDGGQNPVARQMLMHELRGRDHHRSTTSDAAAASLGVEDDGAPGGASAAAANSSSRTTSSSAPAANVDIDDVVSWRDRVMDAARRATTWYQGLNEDQQSLLKLGVGLVVLYVAFGGRFGLSTSTPRPTASGNAYEDYYRQRRQQDAYYRDSSTQYRDNSLDHRRNGNGHDPNYYHSSYSSSWGLDLPSLLPLLLTGAFFYLCHRNGISIWQAMLMFNMMGGRRRRYHGGWYGGGGYGRRQRW